MLSDTQSHVTSGHPTVSADLSDGCYIILGIGVITRRRRLNEGTSSIAAR